MTNTEIHEAVQKNDIQHLKNLVHNGTNINSRDFDRNTPLHVAIKAKTTKEVIKFLLKHEADVNAKDKDGKTSLHLACDPSDFKRVKLLIKYGAYVNARDLSDACPLHYAVPEKNNTRIVQLLIQNGANFKAKDKFGRTPFLRACGRTGNIDNVKFLYQIGADIKDEDCEGDGVIHYAVCTEQNTEIIKFLLENGADVNLQNQRQETPLLITAFWSILDNMEILLQIGADVNFKPHLVDKVYELYEEEPLEMKKIIRRHLIKLRNLNLADDSIFEIWRFPTTLESEEWKMFDKFCKAEVEKLREIISPERKIRFLDLLTEKLNRVAVYLKVDETVEELRQEDLDERFPLYSGLLKSKIIKCTNLAKLITQGCRSVEFIMGSFKMPETVLTRIVTFLNEKDLEILNLIFWSIYTQRLILSISISEGEVDNM